MALVVSLGRRAAAGFFGLCGILPAALFGCGGQRSDAVEESFFRLDAIYRAYRDFCNRDSARTKNLSKGPRSLEDLKEHLVAFGDPDVLLCSPLDSRPYQVILGVNPMSWHAEEDIEPAVLAYECEGAGGQRWVLMTNGRVVRMNHEEFAAVSKASALQKSN